MGWYQRATPTPGSVGSYRRGLQADVLPRTQISVEFQRSATLWPSENTGYGDTGPSRVLTFMDDHGGDNHINNSGCIFVGAAIATWTF